MKAYLKKVLAQILGVSKGVIEFFLPIFQKQIATSLERLLPIALGIVTELATNKTMTPGAKRDYAVNYLKEASLKEGIIAGTSLINFAIEAAVQRIKFKNE